MFAKKHHNGRAEFLRRQSATAFRMRRFIPRADSGKVDAMIHRRNNEDVLWKKIR
jgi:hypothetical protein